jgi:hypothetical protein
MENGLLYRKIKHLDNRCTKKNTEPHLSVLLIFIDFECWHFNFIQLKNPLEYPPY